MRKTEKLQTLNLKSVMMNIVGISLCPNAMWVDKSFYLTMESDYVLKPHMNDIFAEALSIQKNWIKMVKYLQFSKKC